MPKTERVVLRDSRRLLLVIVVVFGMLGVTALIGEFGGTPPPPGQPVHATRPDEAPATDTGAAPELAALPPRATSAQSAGPEADATRAEHTTLDLLRCVSAADATPVAGARMYRDVDAISRPSGADGVLELFDFDLDAPGRLTVWAAGWKPLRVRARPLPEEVALEPAAASLEVRLVGATQAHRLVRSQLAPRGETAPPRGPWTPRLEAWGVDRWGAEQLVAGSYDVYVWVPDDEGDPRPYSEREVELVAGGVTRLQFDVAAPRGDEQQEDDS